MVANREKNQQIFCILSFPTRVTRISMHSQRKDHPLYKHKNFTHMLVETHTESIFKQIQVRTGTLLCRKIFVSFPPICQVPGIESVSDSIFLVLACLHLTHVQGNTPQPSTTHARTYCIADPLEGAQSRREHKELHKNSIDCFLMRCTDQAAFFIPPSCSQCFNTPLFSFMMGLR